MSMLLHSCLLFSLATAQSCSAITRKVQSHPLTYVSNTVKADRNLFEAHEQKHLAAANAQIPALCDEAIRVATFNVHYFKDLHAKNSNLSGIMGDVKAMDATVVIMEEVVNTGSEKNQLDSDMKAAGYVHQAEGYGSGAWLGNVIHSKLPLTNTKVTQLGSARCLVQATIGTGAQAINLYGTHLEVKGGQVRLKQAQQITSTMDLTGRSLLTGDMNAHENTPPIQEFKSKLSEAFSILSWPQATYTCWAGTTIDFFFLSQALKGDLLGVYVYHTLTSDHLPVMVDIKMDKAAAGLASSSSPSPQTQSGTSYLKWILIAGGVLTLLAVSAFLIWHFCLRSQTGSVLPK